jgi:FkbM family methyltransferase
VDQATPIIAAALSALGGRCGGAFIDIGANDGVTISNSFYLEAHMGWRGACIEPLPKTFAKMRAARPLCYALNAAGSSKPGGAALKFMQVEGYAEMLSTFVDGTDPSVFEAIKTNIAEHGGSMTVIDVATKTLAEVVLDHADVASCATATIDFLSLDVESRELTVLQGVDWKRMLFRIIIAEAGGDDRRKALADFMAAQGYTEHTDAGLVGTNNIAFMPLPETVQAHAAAARLCPTPLLASA